MGNQTKGVYYEEEQLELIDSLSLPKEFEIPSNFPEGKYAFNINARFKGQNVPLFGEFIVRIPWYKEKIIGIPKPPHKPPSTGLTSCNSTLILWLGPHQPPVSGTVPSPRAMSHRHIPS